MREPPSSPRSIPILPETLAERNGLLMKLTDQLTDYIHAACTGLWIHTHEADEAEREILQHARQQDWKAAVWDVANGLRLSGTTSATGPDANDPLAALRALPALAQRNGTALLLLHHFHRFLANPEVVQTTFNQLIAGKQQRTFLVVLSPVVQIPVELEKLFVVLEHALPDRPQLEGIARELTSDTPDDLPQGEALQRVLDAAAGLTRYEAEAAFALSLTRHSAIRPEAIWELKSQTSQEEQSAHAAPRRRTLRSAGWTGQPQGLLPPRPASRQERQAARHPASGRPRHGQKLLRKGVGQRGGSPYFALGHRRPLRFAGRCYGGQHPPSSSYRRCHESLVYCLWMKSKKRSAAPAVRATAAWPRGCSARF